MELWTALAAIPSRDWLWWVFALGSLGGLTFWAACIVPLLDDSRAREAKAGADTKAEWPSTARTALIGAAMAVTAVIVTNMTPTDGERIVPEVVAYVEDTEDISVLGGGTYTPTQTGGTVTAIGVDDDGTQFDVVVTWLPVQHTDGQDLTALPAQFEPVTVTLTEREPDSK